MCVKPLFLYAGALMLFVWINSTSVRWIYNRLVPRGAMGVILLWAKRCSDWWLPCVLAGSTSCWGRKKVQLHTSFIRAGIWFLPVDCSGRTHFRGEEVLWPRLWTTAPYIPDIQSSLLSHLSFSSFQAFFELLHSFYFHLIVQMISLISHSGAAPIRSFGDSPAGRSADLLLCCSARKQNNQNEIWQLPLQLIQIFPKIRRSTFDCSRTETSVWPMLKGRRGNVLIQSWRIVQSFQRNKMAAELTTSGERHYSVLCHLIVSSLTDSNFNFMFKILKY